MLSRALLFTVIALSVSFQSAPAFKIINRFPIPGPGGGFDYLLCDEATRRIFISHATQVEVLNADTGAAIGVIPDTPGVHGIAIAPKSKHGFTSNGRSNNVSMFDSETLKLIRKIDVGKGPDGIYFDPGTNRIFTNNHGTHDVTALDASSGDVVGTVKLESDGEKAVIAADGLIYVNGEDTAEVIAFDPKSLEVKKRFKIGVAKTPTGLAYDAKTNLLLIGCREEPKMVAMNAGTGKVISSFPIGKGVDYAGYDAKKKLAFFSCSDGNLNVFEIKSATQVADLGAVKTQPSARTLAFDSKTGRILLPAVEYIETPAAEPGKRPTRTVKPGSFTLLVLGQ